MIGTQRAARRTSRSANRRLQHALQLWLMSLLALAASGCATLPARAPLALASLETAAVPEQPDARLWLDAPASEWIAWRTRWLQDRARHALHLQQSRTERPLALLAISSGSDKGAFSAGFLDGWTARGDRPEFAMVSGVSTGALVAPFAFLGPRYDHVLKEIYTGIDSHDIYRPRPLEGLLGGVSLADTGPLRELVARHVTPELLGEISREHLAGRRLLVMTTNLDARRGVVWDMGAIASSGRANRLVLFRSILLASASIPGVFPPVMIEVEDGGRRFEEMHVDGGTAGSLFALPPAIIWDSDEPASDRPEAAMTMLYNGVLDRTPEVVQPKALTIMGAALEMVIADADRRGLRVFAAFAELNGMPLNVEAIGTDFTQVPNGLFDRSYMAALFDYGRSRARRHLR